MTEKIFVTIKESKRFRIPEKLVPYSEEIKKTFRSMVRIDLKVADSLKPWQSKVGGKPYLPLTEEYPLNNEGKPLMFLAQINFSEVPYLKHFPNKGILTFYLDGLGSEIYGLDFYDQTKQEGFRALYYENVHHDESKLHTKFPKIKKKDIRDFPIKHNFECSMAFKSSNQYITTHDHRFKKLELAKKIELIHIYAANLNSRTSILGGYPFFTQEDPRSKFGSRIEEYELLFQLNSRNFGIRRKIKWDLYGIGNFFIHPEDLEKRDFTKVLFNWDSC